MLPTGVQEVYSEVFPGMSVMVPVTVPATSFSRIKTPLDNAVVVPTKNAPSQKAHVSTLKMSTTALGKAMLDDNNLAVPVNDTLDSYSKLTLFKIDLTNNSSINTIRNLNDGCLNPGSISISENDNYYIITSILKSNNTKINRDNQIFLW